MPLDRRQSKIIVAIASMATLLVAGCSADADPSTEDDTALDEVTYLTGFGTFGREAPAYVALDKGYFEEAGIKVDIQPGSGTVPNVEQAVGGQADFVIGDSTGAMLMHGEGNDDFTIVAALHQQTVFGFIALEGSGIESPQDLEGKVIGDAPGSFGSLVFPTYANQVGIDPSSVDYNDSIPPPQLPSSLASGQVDAISQFVLGKPTIEAAADGTPAVVLPMSDVLTDLYGAALVVSNELATEDPDLVTRFVSAFVRGVEDAVNDPQEAAEILNSYVPESNPEVAAEELRLMGPYVQPPETGGQIGRLDPERFARAIALLEAAEAIPSGSTPEDIVSFDLFPQN